MAIADELNKFYYEYRKWVSHQDHVPTHDEIRRWVKEVAMPGKPNNYIATGIRYLRSRDLKKE